MTCSQPSRFRRVTPTLVLLISVFLSACASAPPRPQAPIFQGGERVDPVRPGQISEEDQADLGGGDAIDEASLQPLDDGYTPPHMTGRAIKRFAVLLPFSHQNAAVARQAEGILAGIELALFNSGNTDILLLPKDTRGKRSDALARTEEAIEEKADLIIGPLFAANVQEVRGAAQAAGLPVVAFSNDPAAAGEGAYLISIAPEEEMARIVDYASRADIQTFAFLGPDNAFGRRMGRRFALEATLRGGTVLPLALYAPSNDAPVDEAQQLANAINAELEVLPEDAPPLGVMILERGVKLRGVAPLLPYYGVDTRRVQLLGPSSWQDESLWREPTLQGGLFAGPPQEDLQTFAAAYERNYGRAPTSLASLGYDATALAIQLAQTDAITVEGLTEIDGFVGVNGLFRFRLDGTAERGLAVYEITRSGQTRIKEPGARSFAPEG